MLKKLRDRSKILQLKTSYIRLAWCYSEMLPCCRIKLIKKKILKLEQLLLRKSIFFEIISNHYTMSVLNFINHASLSLTHLVNQLCQICVLHSKSFGVFPLAAMIPFSSLFMSFTPSFSKISP